MKMDGVIKPAVAAAQLVPVPVPKAKNLPSRAVVDLKVNNSDGPVRVRKGERVNLTWTSTGNDIVSCVSGDFNTGNSKPTNGNILSDAIVTDEKTFTISCKNTNGDIVANDSVTVIKRPQFEEISPNEIPQ